VLLLLMTVIVAAFVYLISAGFVARRQLKQSHAAPPVSPHGSRWLLRFVRPYRSPLKVAVGLIMIHTLVDLAAPWPLKVMIDNAIGGEELPPRLSALDGLSPSILAFVSAATGLSLVLLSVLLTYLVTYLVGATEVRIAADIRAAVFRRLQDLSLRFHDKNRTGDLVSRLTTDVGRVRNVIVAWFDSVLPDVLTLVGILVIMLVVDVTLTLLALSVVPLLLYYAFLKRPQIRAAQREAQDRNGELASQATDTLRNVRVVQTFSRQANETERFSRQLDRTAEAAITSLDVSARYTPISALVLALGTALVSWVGVMKVINDELSLGTLLVLLAYLASLYRPIRSLSRNVSTFAKGAASRDRLLELFDDDHVVREDPDAVEASSTDTRLELKRINFSYEADAPVLRKVSLSIRPGVSVCIVGASGVGKSTLLSLLLRLYEPTSGSIRLGGIDIRHLTLDSLRQRIALVPQDPWMMDGTIGENIAFGQGQATGIEVLDAARTVGVDKFAESLPRGYDTPVGEGGVLLSGGQRRRVALARALIRDAPILILDEPTSGLDAESATEVLDAIDAVIRVTLPVDLGQSRPEPRHDGPTLAPPMPRWGSVDSRALGAAEGRTILVVSHDLSVASRTDRVIFMEDGAITERGTHRQLLASGGRYARMWGMQQRARDRDDNWKEVEAT
jgi:ABC-type multidrug transport system fused ATPase/permease subunit